MSNSNLYFITVQPLYTRHILYIQIYYIYTHIHTNFLYKKKKSKLLYYAFSTLNYSVYKKFSFFPDFFLVESSFPGANRPDFYLSFFIQLVFYLICFGLKDRRGVLGRYGGSSLNAIYCRGFLGWIFEFTEWYLSASSVYYSLFDADICYQSFFSLGWVGFVEINQFFQCFFSLPFCT